MKMKIKAILGTILILAACSVFAACSGDDDGDSGDSSTYDSKLAGGTYLNEQGMGYKFNSDHSVTNITLDIQTTFDGWKWQIIDDGMKVEMHYTGAGTQTSFTFDVADSSFTTLNRVSGTVTLTYTRQ